MVSRKLLNVTLLLVVVASLVGGAGLAQAQPMPPDGSNPKMAQMMAMQNPPPPPAGREGLGNGQMRSMTQAERQAAALKKPLPQKGVSQHYAGVNAATARYSPLNTNTAAMATMAAPLASGQLAAPDYFGVANWANSPLPTIDPDTGAVSGGMHKFVDTLPPLCAIGQNDLGQCLPLGAPDTTTFSGNGTPAPASDYYEIGLVEYTEKLHADLPPTRLRGYVQLVPASAPGAVALTTANGLTMNIVDRNGNQLYGATRPQYLGPVILAAKNRPVRVKFTNLLPTGAAGDLFIPTDNTYMGAGEGPLCADGTPATPTSTCPRAVYTENRATLHLHGGATPWISDGTPHQWTVPFNELAAVAGMKKGVSTAYVPDMWFDANGDLIPSCAGQTSCGQAGASTNPGDGSMTFYWTNQQGGRLMFYHDHAYGITRLNVYAGEAAGYLLADPTAETALKSASVPGTISNPANPLDPANDVGHMVPLVIQDKSFVPDDGTPGGQLAASDPTWDTVKYGGKGSLWFPHVYMPNQNPADVSGADAFGRWDYGPWFWPPQDPSTLMSQPYDCTSAAYDANNPPAFPPLQCPGMPNPSGVPEGFMDTPMINGTAYPSLAVNAESYRFQILNAGNDRTLNLGVYVAEPLSIAVTNGGSGYTAAPTVNIEPAAGDTTGGGASATAVMSTGSVTQILVTGVGSGYTSTTPNVTITGDGTGAAATAVIDPLVGQVTAINVTNIGTGYTYADVAIDPPAGCTTGCVTATAAAAVTPSGTVLNVTVTNPGSGWTLAPVVTFTNATGDTTGSGAAAIASINSEVKMVPAVPPTTSSALKLCSTTTPTSGAMLAMATLDAKGNPINGTGLPANCWPTTWPTDGRDGGVPDPGSAGPPIIQIGTEGGLLPQAVAIPSTPVGFEYNRRSITVLNVFQHGLMLGPAERADVVVDFSRYAGKTLILYNDAPAPVPAFDPRNDYYTGDPDQTSTGGAPTTLPGYGPNTRTIMQIKVNTGTPNATVVSLPALQNATSGLPAIFAATQDKIIVPEQAYPAANGGSTAPNYVRIQDTSMNVFNGPITGLSLTRQGSGYTTAPNVNITGGGGSGATATAALPPSPVAALTLGGGGSGYTTAPTVAFAGGGGGSGAAATAVLPAQPVATLSLTANGSGYTTAPTVAFAGGGGGAGAVATARLAPRAVASIAVTANGSGYRSVPTVTITSANGDGSGATARANLTGQRVTSVTLLTPGSGYTTAPNVAISGGGGTGAAATARLQPAPLASVALSNGGNGYTTAPTVSLSGGGGGTGAAVAATLAPSPVARLNLTNPGSGYTTAPAVSINPTNGAGSGATASAALPPSPVASVTLTSGGNNYTSAPTVSVVSANGAGSGATAVATAIMPLQPKAIQELFTLDYGRMNATLGVEIPKTNFQTQTTIPYGYVDPPTEIFKNGETQLWKITHNGVDTHFIHFHLFNVQVINRVGWDGAIKPPDANELSWKDTVRMNPLEDIIVALTPLKQTLPWDLPNSVRPLDVTQPVGWTSTMSFTNVDPSGQPANVVNDMVNFGWEYVWHCHILGHEENDMMRAMILAVAPNLPGTPTASVTGSGTSQQVVLNWADNSLNETGFTIQRATNAAGPWATVGTVGQNVRTFTDTTVARRTTYYYRVIANNVVGVTRPYTLPAIGYPHTSADSAPTGASNAAVVQ